MNILQKLYNKIHLNSVLALIFLFFLYIVYLSVITSHKILFSCISASRLSCVKDMFALVLLSIIKESLDYI